MATYPKPYMKVSEIVATMGIAKHTIITDIHSKCGPTFACKAGKGGRTSRWMIDTEAYAKYTAKKMKLEAGGRR